MADKRGRPATFDLRTRKYFARLIQRHGVRGTREVSKVPVSQHTLTKVAREFDIQLLAGRRPSDPALLPNPKLNNLQKARLEQILSRGPIAAGYRADRWSYRRITDLVHKLFGIKCHAIHLQGLLKGLSPHLNERRVLQMRFGKSVRQIPEESAATAEMPRLKVA